MTSGIEQFVLRVVNDLVVEFHGVHPRATVMEIVLRTSLDLQDQIAPEAASEMLCRLARHRLAGLAADGQRDSLASPSSSRQR